MSDLNKEQIKNAMEQALEKALLVSAKGEVPVGCVILDEEGTVLAAVGNRPIGDCDPTAHAEIRALRKAAKKINNYRLTGCTLVVSIEPCLMCLGAMTHARIGHLVYGAPEPKGGGVEAFTTMCENRPLNHAFTIESGVMAKQAADLMKNFFKARR